MTARTICVRLTGPQMRALRIAVGAARDLETLNRAWEKVAAAWENQARR